MANIDGIVYLILAACLLPYVFSIIAKVVGGFRAQDNQNPREFLAKSTGLAARANAVQQNSFESLPLFIAAVLMCELLIVPQFVVMTFGFAYLVLRILYGLCYLLNLASLRSVMWLLSMLCPISMLLIAGRIIFQA